MGPPETQVLTEHQREVRDRQRIDSSRLFSNIQSSSDILQRDPTPSHTAHPLPDAQTDAPGTPQLPVSVAVNDDEVPLSSPTPGSKEQNAQLAALAAESSFPSLLGWNSDDAGPPSSPPQPTEKSTLHTFKPVPFVKKPSVAEQTGNMSCSVTERRRSRLSVSDEDSRVQSGSKRKDGPEVEGNNSSSVLTVNKKRKTASASAHSFHNAPPVDAEPARPTEKAALAPSTATDDRDMVDMIPDSFSDVLEQQIASQLEQDLELSMDSALAEGDSTTQHARQNKRKRGGKFVSNGREKKATKSNSPDVDISASVPPDDHIRGTEPSHSDSEAEPKPTRPRRSLRSTSQKTSNPPALTRRRSSRLKGEAASDEPEEKEPERAQQSEPTSGDPAGAVAAEAEAPRENDPADGLPSGTAAPTTDPRRVEVHPDQRPSTPNSILSSLRGILGSLKNMSFGRSTLREMDDLMFNIRMEAHDAVKRHES